MERKEVGQCEDLGINNRHNFCDRHMLQNNSKNPYDMWVGKSAIPKPNSITSVQMRTDIMGGLLWTCVASDAQSVT